jgi:23S rRNA pseudouridine1911/1915/1917 synthase
LFWIEIDNCIRILFHNPATLIDSNCRLQKFGYHHLSSMKLPRPGRRGDYRHSRRQPRAARKLIVLYEDESVIALNKPAGLTSVPAPGSDTTSALTLLMEELSAKRERALVVHRIDRFTSGILLFAKTERDRHPLIRQFLAHTPVRQYLTVVRGRLKLKEGTLVHFFRREGQFQKLSTQRDSQAARAELRYSLEQPLRGASLVRATLVTGFQNQIRVQFSAIGHPVIGDRKYHPSEASEPRIDRVALHAAHLEFIHPRTQQRISIDCEPPADFQSLVKSLQLRSSNQGAKDAPG